MDRPGKVLVIDDDARVRDEIRTRLDALPYPIELAESPDRARPLLDGPTPCVLVLGHGLRSGEQPSLEALLDEVHDRIALIILEPPSPPSSASPSDRAASIAPPADVPCEIIRRPVASDRLQHAVEIALEQLATHMARLPADDERHDGEQPELEDLAWLGGLAAMLAHELTSPLDGSLRYLGMLRRQLNGGSELLDYIEEIEHGLGRMARMIRALLAFSRSASTQRPPRPLEVMLTEAEQQTRRHTPHPDITVEVRGEGPAPDVPADLFQVFANLMRNAFDAMPSGGRLAVDWFRRPQELEILFEDEGPGFDEDGRRRAFEPFYTTKPFGRGTGLGLSICRRLVAGLGGRIMIAESTGLGARIRVIVPLEARGAPTDVVEPQR